MIYLYGRGQSRSFRALWALNEAGLPHQYIEVDGDNPPENYLRMNPQGKVPTLVDDDVTLTESAAMVNYAGNLAGLMPADNKIKARYDEIAYFVMTDFEQPLWTIGKHRFALPEAHRQESILSTAMFEFEKSQKALHHHIDGCEFAVGTTFTMADVLLSHTINWADRFEMPLDDDIKAFRDRHYARAACRASLEAVGA